MNDYQYSYLQVNFTGDYISFDWELSGSENYDYLTLYIDGVEKDELTGRKYLHNVYHYLTYGPHSVKWELTRFPGSSVMIKGIVDKVTTH